MRPLTRGISLAVVLFAAVLAIAARPARVWSATAANDSMPVTASPNPTPDPASDPCAGPGRLLATLDRPTVGYSVCAVPKGAIVLEEGYQNQSQGGTATSVTATYPQSFQRFGVADRIEVDLVGPAYNRSRVGTTISTGYSDLGLGFKYELPPKNKFTYAVDGLFQAATGTGGFGLGGPTSATNIDIGYAASPAVGIASTLSGYSTVGSSTDGSPIRYGYFAPSLVVTLMLPTYVQFYAEVAGRTKIAPDRGGETFTDFGVQKLFGPSVEIDGEYGIDFTPVAGSRFHYVGFGLGVRVK